MRAKLDQRLQARVQAISKAPGILNDAGDLMAGSLNLPCVGGREDLACGNLALNVVSLERLAAELFDENQVLRDLLAEKSKASIPVEL